MRTPQIDPSLARNPLVVISRVRSVCPGSKVAARVRLLCVASMAMMPRNWTPTGKSWSNETSKGCSELIELEQPSGPNNYVYRPIEGRTCTNDVIFASASFAWLFGLDLFTVEWWLWTGQVMTVDQVLAR